MACRFDRNLCACCVECVVDLRRKEVRIGSLSLRREAKQLVNHWAHQLSESWAFKVTLPFVTPIHSKQHRPTEYGGAYPRLDQSLRQWTWNGMANCAMNSARLSFI